MSGDTRDDRMKGTFWTGSQLFVVHQELGLEIIRMMMSSKTRRRRILGWLAADLNHDDDDEWTDSRSHHLYLSLSCQQVEERRVGMRKNSVIQLLYEIWGKWLASLLDCLVCCLFEREGDSLARTGSVLSDLTWPSSGVDPSWKRVGALTDGLIIRCRPGDERHEKETERWMRTIGCSNPSQPPHLSSSGRTNRSHHARSVAAPWLADWWIIILRVCWSLLRSADEKYFFFFLSVTREGRGGEGCQWLRKKDAIARRDHIPAALLHSPRGVPGIKRKDKERKGGKRSTGTVSETEEFNHGLALRGHLIGPLSWGGGGGGGVVVVSGDGNDDCCREIKRNQEDMENRNREMVWWEMDQGLLHKLLELLDVVISLKHNDVYLIWLQISQPSE
jgi:hypothetical protein